MNAPTRAHIFRAALRERILVIDGATGTLMQSYGLTEADYRGERFTDHPSDLMNNTDVLCLTRPDVVRRVHDTYIESGAEVLETNTFGANAVSQADFGLEAHAAEMCREGARIAREAADAASTPERPIFVAGVLGPTTRTASISPDVDDPGARNITWDELVHAYAEATEALIDGGTDVLLIETVFDTLNAKAAIYAVRKVLDDRGVDVPLWISGTITDLSGRTLSGQTTEAFWHSIRHGRPDVVGLNCALGADELRGYVRELARVADCSVSAHPNAGLPNELGGYDETPEAMAAVVREFAESGLVNMVGGCCGTGPGHVRAIADAVAPIAPRPIPEIEPRLRLSGLEPFILGPDSLFVNVGERTNVTGSARFRKLIEADDYETALSVARQQVENGAQIIDVNMDAGLLDGEAAMARFLNLLAGEPDIAKVPVMIDSSKWTVIEEGLKRIQGKGVVNSISLKEGEDAFREQAREILRYGAAVVVMAFDETGQADSIERKFEICARSYRILVDEVGFPPEDIIFDPNVFAVATGIEEHANYGVDFIEATRWIKTEPAPRQGLRRRASAT